MPVNRLQGGGGIVTKGRLYHGILCRGEHIGVIIFVDEVQVHGKEKQVERKEVYDFTDTPFHKYWI